MYKTWWFLSFGRLHYPCNAKSRKLESVPSKLRGFLL